MTAKVMDALVEVTQRFLEAKPLEHGPSPVHRMRFVNVRRAAGIIDAPPFSLEPQLELWDTDDDLQEVLR